MGLLYRSIWWGDASNSDFTPQRRTASLMAKVSRLAMLYPINTASGSAVIRVLSSRSTSSSLLNSMLRDVAPSRSSSVHPRNFSWIEMAPARPCKYLSHRQCQVKHVLDVSAAAQSSFSYATTTKHNAYSLFCRDAKAPSESHHKRGAGELRGNLSLSRFALFRYPNTKHDPAARQKTIEVLQG